MEINGNWTASDYAVMYRQKLNWPKENKEKPFAGILSENKNMELLAEHLHRDKKAPYSHLAKDGIIMHNGVVFVCNDEKQQLTLGDVSDPRECISVQMSDGGSFVFNRNKIGDLAKAIDMFSPEDVKRIMYAIAQDAKCKQMETELEEDINSLGEAAERLAGGRKLDKQET